MDLRELGANLAAAEQEQTRLDITSEEVDAIQADLVHAHLPKLEDVGLVDWDQSANTVTTTDHPALSDPKFQQMVDTNAPGWEAVLDNLASKRRRVILATLKDADTALTRDELVQRVVAREYDDTADQQETIDEVLADLHHIHLPKLEQADLIFYDTDTETAMYIGHPALDDEWLDFRPNETPRAIVPTAHHPDDI